MEKMTSGKASAPLSMPIPRSPWHSPVPYLFGGLAAMLGLIAFALLILACSYWKLSSRLENRETEDRDLEAGGSGDGDLKPAAAAAAPHVFEEKILVIMAGHEKPTYLATPMSSRASSFVSNTTCTTTAETNHKSDDDDDDDDNTSTCASTSASVVVDHVQRTSNMEDNHETTIQVP